MAGKSLNKVMLIGNLGKDPELRYSANGLAVASFSIATNESTKDVDGNLQERTEWHNVIAFGKLAQICNDYLKKGQKVYIEGSIRTRSYDDKNGIKRYVTEIFANDLIMLSAGKGVEESATDTNVVSEPKPEIDTQPEDDLPF
ncbi:MAG: Single-stranded DNA-binding protein [Ignavibacteriae bacterium]|nr:MAG: Single-stranded DNA-binding protein [Ignavibacteriota bacterium]